MCGAGGDIIGTQRGSFHASRPDVCRALLELRTILCHLFQCFRRDIVASVVFIGRRFPVRLIVAALLANEFSIIAPTVQNAVFFTACRTFPEWFERGTPKRCLNICFCEFVHHALPFISENEGMELASIRLRTPRLRDTFPQGIPALLPQCQIQST